MTVVSCGAGKYSESMLSSSISDCKSCPPGFYCTNDIPIPKLEECPAGRYCTGGSATALGTGQCSTGFYCPLGSTAMIACDLGKYCPTAGLSAPFGFCDAGYYCL